MTVRRDAGAGLISTAAGIVVFLVFLLFSVQLLFSLYAWSTVTAVANDAAQQAAAAEGAPLELIEASARRHLGEVGKAASFEWSYDDMDADGSPDTVVLEVVASPPRFLSASFGGAVGLEEIRRTARARLEGFIP